jgi:hypothetical protein
MKTMLVLLFVLGAAAPAFADKGAIAWSPSTGTTGQSWNAACDADARATAVNYCGIGDCFVAVTVSDGCAALAVGDGNRYGTAWSSDQSTAQANALASCNGQTSSCRLVAWTCSG